MSHSSIAWLVDWYAAQCDGDWEHSYGVEIGTLDNPGWSLEIDLRGTVLQDRVFEQQAHNSEDDTDWWICWVEDSTFRASGGAKNLEDMAGIFRAWASG